MKSKAESQLAQPGVLREHRGAFAVEDPLELRRPDAGDELAVLLRHARHIIKLAISIEFKSLYYRISQNRLYLLP